MPLQIVILYSAKFDILSASHWYESQQPGLGRKFKQEISKAIDSILDPRRGHGPVYMNLSRIFVKKFPYVIYFKINTTREKCVVYGVLSEKQSREDILRGRA